MGLDVWSYDLDKISCFSKYHCTKNQYDIFISRDPMSGRHIYPNNINTTQYLRSSYNGSGYDSIARVYGCIPILEILNPIQDSIDNTGNITKESIQQSLGIAKCNLEKWITIKALSDNELIFRPEVLEYSNNFKDDTLVHTIDIIFNNYIIYSSFTVDLINKSINNMKKNKYKNYIIKYNRNNSLKGIIKLNNNIIGLYKDDLNYYLETATTIIKFVEELLQMEEPVLCYWG